MENTKRPVVVCTKYRGVFFGYTEDTTNGTVTLTNARMCVYWHKSLKGVLGLASSGPSKGCRVGDAVERIELRGVTAIIECSDKAVERWEAAPWS